MVKPVTIITVQPNLPGPLQGLAALAHDLRWSWDPACLALFRRLDPQLWEETDHNPVRLLGQLSQERLQAAAADPALLRHLERMRQSREQERHTEQTWYRRHSEGLPPEARIAYFSMEFGLAEALRNYSGGLGVLSGDHLKSASDLGVPLVGVGLLYQEGYFHQYLNSDGYQQESYPVNDVSSLPLTLMRDAEGHPLRVSLPMPGAELHAVIWRAQVGRVPLYLLDTNIGDNIRPEYRNLTDRLYGGDRRQRIRQEMLLGMGGIRALDVLGLRPDVCHMNEGHSAFLAIERIRQLVQEHNLSFQQARELARSGHIFTTHTPVPAGNERFEFWLVDEHFQEYFHQLGITRETFFDLGREDMGDHQLFSMTALAMRLSSGTNAVSQLHGRVSREMWRKIWPGVPLNEVPIGAITNGIHLQTWISEEMAALFDHWLDPAWRSEQQRPEIWAAVDKIPDGELWRIRELLRARLVAFTRERLRAQLGNRGFARSEMEAAASVLRPDALTIGFARRFATYKRATLIFRDPQRLKRLLNDPQRPAQLLFAGKAHPHDGGGKDLIRHIVHMSQEPELRERIVFLENYDMNIGRILVQGVDLWLNTPRRPHEASGTSGMKAVYNAGLNCSILDGWWNEGHDQELGWAIGRGEEYPEHEAEHQDHVESQALYRILEQDVIPLFYDRGRDGLPQEWIRCVKRSIRALAPAFNSHRMLQQYTQRYYLPALKRARDFVGEDARGGLILAEWRAKIERHWSEVRVRELRTDNTQLLAGQIFEVEARIELGNLSPADVRAQLWLGRLHPQRLIDETDGAAVDMQPVGMEHGVWIFRARHVCHTSGQRGISARVLPHHESLASPFLPNLITWAQLG